ncbi:MAG: TetR/AcrR family transcriptional regulator, partial [Chloroflexales bacterium]|nr:TetR/AcrR family transcriptional regulator [Chloroflexales bacterium]
MVDEATPSRRERQREATSDEIKQVARQQMAEEGTAGLSLRGIARQMGLSAPALYRYYPSRDELITALIVDAFHALGDATQAAQVHMHTSDYAGRFLAMTVGYRQWALDHPVDFALIYGNPIPGYHAPAEVTTPAVRRSTAPLVNLLNESWLAGAMAPLDRAISPTVEAHLAGWAQQA